MTETNLTDAPRSQRGIFVAGLLVLAVAVAGTLYLLLQGEMPTVLAVVIGLFIAAFAIGRFYLVATRQFF